MIPSPPTAEDCILAVIACHGIRGVRVVVSDVDRIYCSDDDGLLEEWLLAQAFAKTVSREQQYQVERHHPGAIEGFREKCAPSLQAVLMLTDDLRYRNGKKWGLDLDFFPLKHLSWFIPRHWIEAGRNFFTKQKTDPVAMAKSLREKRGISLA